MLCNSKVLYDATERLRALQSHKRVVAGVHFNSGELNRVVTVTTVAL
jgi:hypothetical protein